MSFYDLIEIIKNIKDTKHAKELLLNQVNTPLIQKAIDFSILAHKDQKRKSGEDYVIHPLLVATIVSFFNKDEEVII
ncbi:MAG TPA: bifunctional (p)ppGpp synthase/hydrolase, partial [Nautiliaceae bacterium]|nr:bifunctional (p)ppGpp synthase/hydrolase [Nautiliaceae bacterium]